MGCLIRSIFTAALVVVIAVFAFLNRERLQTAWQNIRGEKEQVQLGPSAELAESANGKIAELKSGKSDRVALSEMELQSLLQYKYRELLPAFVDSPQVALNGSQIEVKARVPVDRLPQINELGEAAGFLPDTTELSVRGELLPLQNRRVALAVDQVRAARIPLPQRLVHGALQKLGRKDEPGLPPDALAIRLPPGADAAYVRNDSLIFMKN